MINFENKEDYLFFLDKLANGDEELFDDKYSSMFDFSDPVVKRSEFNKIRNDVFKQLVSLQGLKCQLGIHDDCSKEELFDVDHFIPLSTNELNKKFRGIIPEQGKKVKAQSLGSNHIFNLKIACKRCNAYKKHRIVDFI